jgi:hypothetical protein
MGFGAKAAVTAAAFVCLGCEPAPPNAPGSSERSGPQPDSAHGPYAGEWAASQAACRHERDIWTIEPRRMGIYPQLRYCLFDSVYADVSGRRAEVWSASATCLHEGRSSRDFIFFRLTADGRSMRVTFNDTRPVRLVRCSEI